MDSAQQRRRLLTACLEALLHGHVDAERALVVLVLGCFVGWPLLLVKHRRLSHAV